MERAEAEAHVLDYLNQGWDQPGDERALVPGTTIDKPYGWVFFYQSRQYLETGDHRHMLVGHGPVIVLDDGTIHTLGSARPPEEEVAAFEAQHRLPVTHAVPSTGPAADLEGLPIWVGAPEYDRHPVLALTHPGIVSAELTPDELERLPHEGPGLLNNRGSVTVPWKALDRVRTDGEVGLRVERGEDIDVTIRFATPAERDAAFADLHSHLAPHAPLEQLRRPRRQFFELALFGLCLLALGFVLPWMVESGQVDRAQWIFAVAFNTLGPTGFRALGVLLAVGCFAGVILLAVRNPVRTGFRVHARS